MRSRHDKSKFLEILSESPWISFAAKKVGISRATIYRWMKDDVDFKQAVGDRIDLGRTGIYEAAEMVVMARLKANDLQAAKFVLTNNDPRYMTKRSVYVAPTDAHENLEHGERCRYCGLVKGYSEKSPGEIRASKALDDYLSTCHCDKHGEDKK